MAQQLYNSTVRMSLENSDDFYLAVVGSRSYLSYYTVKYLLQSFYIKYGKQLVLVSGGAVGADKLAEQFAHEFGLRIMVLLPDWDTHGRAAGFIRNSDIVATCDELIAFWDKKSRGTIDSYNKAIKAKKPAFLVDFTLEP